MKAKSSARAILLIMAIMVVSLVFTAVSVPTIDVAYAEGSLEDNVGGSSESSDSSDDLFSGIKDQEMDPEDKGVSDWLKNQRGVTSNQLESASQTMSPITNIIGYISSAIIILIIAGVVTITALDLMYIAIPPTRNFLYKAGTDGTGGFTGGYGAGGFGRMGGMSMGAGGAAGGSNKPTQWVSDEAVACAAMLGGSAQSAQGGMMPGMGGYGAMGAMGAQQQQGQMKTKSVIAMYFKKKLFFLILLAICIVVLTSSAVMNCGVNLAEWFIKIVNMFNDKMSAT